MTTRMRPRLDEFFLALLWTVGATLWGYYGVVGYAKTLTESEARFNLPGFVVSFFLLCLAVFGLRFALGVYLRLWRKPPAWLDTTASLGFGVTVLAGAIFSFVTLVIVLIHLFGDSISNLVFGWGLAASLGIAGLAFFQLLAALNAFEPFLGWAVQDSNGENKKRRGWLARLQGLHGRNFGPRRTGDQVRGPLVLEADSRSSSIEEKPGGRPGLEKTLVAHGGYHITTLGFSAGGATIFAVSDGGMVHFQAGGRKGVMFPPELKFWDWSSGRVQTATLGAAQTFLTSQYKTPGSLQNYRFLVPQGGSKFAWILPHQIQVGDWSNERLQTLEVEEGLVLRGWGGFAPLAFNPEGSRLAWCTADGQTRFWNMETEQTQPLRAYPVEGPEEQTGTERGAWGLIFSPDGSRIATLGGRGILLQNVYTGWRWFRPLDNEREKLSAFAFSASGFEMAVGLRVRPSAIQVANGKRNRNNGHTHLADSASTETLEASDELVPIVRLWDLREDRYVDLRLDKHPVRELAYSSDNRLLAGVDEGGMLRIWDIAPEGSTHRPPHLQMRLDLGLTGRKTVLNFSPDVTRLVCATDNRILIWNLARLRQEAQV